MYLVGKNKSTYYANNPIEIYINFFLFSVLEDLVHSLLTSTGMLEGSPLVIELCASLALFLLVVGLANEGVLKQFWPG